MSQIFYHGAMQLCTGRQADLLSEIYRKLDLHQHLQYCHEKQMRVFLRVMFKSGV